MRLPKLPRAISIEIAATVRVWREVLLATPVRLWALILAGPPLTGFLAWLVVIIKAERWPVELRGQQLETLGALALCLAALVGVVVVALASVSVKAETRLGSISIGADDEPPERPAPPAAPTYSDYSPASADGGYRPPDDRRQT